jgi:hypothetical protein
MKDIIGLLFYARTVTHLEHLKTKSYAQHKALNEFYDEIVDLADELAEAYQGCEGIIKDIPIFNNPVTDPIDVFLEKQLTLIESLRKKATDRSAIQNIIDTIVGLYLSTLYKLRNLS